MPCSMADTVQQRPWYRLALEHRTGLSGQ
jgi:hypothetical protein